MCARIDRHREQEIEARRLEIQRDAYDYGVTDESPPGAGPEADESSLFATHPGTMYLDHMAERIAKNLPEHVDSHQFSTTLDNVTGSQGQTSEIDGR
ncbi:hypothetical protein HWC80_gp108 [Mycobacterium phage Indlulamithi]|uniref:Uncharacterized protein n=1 Tax=Mycobacterium phage Indlulamithi TaxID=2656582 RepID=A0A649VD15_9CAUD|nr:hypothetical protein HWC80_gp108 [Mycobacterium phage Indlulamithi]QGJ90104.1 hypothetical protein PBI_INDLULAMITHI_66 [Mycobacterium phage Indlulamithi]